MLVHRDGRVLVGGESGIWRFLPEAAICSRMRDTVGGVHRA